MSLAKVQSGHKSPLAVALSCESKEKNLIMLDQEEHSAETRQRRRVAKGKDAAREWNRSRGELEAEEAAPKKKQPNQKINLKKESSQLKDIRAINPEAQAPTLLACGWNLRVR